MDHFPRKAVGNDWSLPQREATKAANGKAVGVELAVSVGTHIIPPQH